MRLGKFFAALALVFGLTLGTTAQAADVVDVAIGSENHKTLVAAVQAAGLVETLQSRGPFTVFAPTDEAFAALPAGTVEDLLKPENKEMLVKILTYHVVPGTIMAKDLAGKQVFANTVEGSPLFASGVADGAVFVSPAGSANSGDMARVIAQVPTGNGVVHVIDKVLLPE